MTLDEKALEAAVEAYKRSAGLTAAQFLGDAITAYLQALRPGSTGETLAIRDALAKADEDDLYREVANRLETPWTAPNGRSYGASKPSAMLAAAGGE